MISRRGADSVLPRVGSWIVHRYPVADFGSSYSGMWRLEEERRQPPLATSDITAILEDMIAPLRRLDDTEGGSAAAVGMVNHQIETITAYLTRGRTTSPDVRRRLMLAGAQLNQLAGWMAFDAERHTTARRYFRAALTAARDGDHTDLTAHILACMAYQAVHCGQLDEGVAYVEAAMRTSEACHPAVRALMSSRLAYVRAASGSSRGFRSARERARGLYQAAADSTAHGPEWLYWFDAQELEYQLVHSGLTLASYADDDPARYFDEAQVLLNGKVSSPDTRTPRDALFHIASLARAYAQHGDLDSVAHVAELGLRRGQGVRSVRARNVLLGLDKDLATHRGARRDPRVRELRTQLREQLA
ncbi:MAG: hypothetical protein ACRDPW_09745 [Mycobacteriales bacterium]